MTWYSGFPDTAEGWDGFYRNEANKNAVKNRREEKEARDKIVERLDDITDALNSNNPTGEILRLKNRIKELETENAKLRSSNNSDSRFDETFGFLYELRRNKDI